MAELSSATKLLLPLLRLSQQHGNDAPIEIVVATVLEALADLVVPQEPLHGGDQRWMYERDSRQSIRSKILAIAAELRGQAQPSSEEL